MIRKRLRENRNTMYLVPEKVRNYIEEKHLYGT
jgi:nicotinate-nucleotide adenylyltransferase